MKGSTMHERTQRMFDRDVISKYNDLHSHSDDENLIDMLCTCAVLMKGGRGGTLAPKNRSHSNIFAF